MSGVREMAGFELVYDVLKRPASSKRKQTVVTVRYESVANDIKRLMDTYGTEPDEREITVRERSRKVK